MLSRLTDLYDCGRWDWHCLYSGVNEKIMFIFFLKSFFTGVIFMWQLQLLYNIVCTDIRHDMIFESFLTFNSLQFTAVSSKLATTVHAVKLQFGFYQKSINLTCYIHVWLSQTQMSTIKTMEILTNLHTTVGASLTGFSFLLYYKTSWTSRNVYF